MLGLWFVIKRDFCNWRVYVAFLFSVIIVLTVGVHRMFISPPTHFPVAAIITIDQGDTLKDVSRQLEKMNVVRSPTWFRSFILLRNGESSVKAGKYVFERPLPVYEIARRIHIGDFNTAPDAVRIPEGANVFEIAAIFDDTFQKFNTARFLRQARPREGYLFPDTYFFTPGTEVESIIEVMEHTFWKRVSEVESDIAQSDRSLAEIITMASIIEKEAYKPEERRMISGILWKRLKEGMRLQVDATFSYVNGKNTFELTDADLISTSSPYNTYSQKGLPPGPIGNPSLDAIEAALNPKTSPYYYYLHGRNGNIHYAETLEGHRTNRRAYLDK